MVDQSFLNTGLSSAIERRRIAEKKRQEAEKQSKRSKLKPVATVIVDAIDREKTRIKDELAELPMSYETSEESIKSYLLAVKLHIRFLDSFKTQLLNTMREDKNE